MIRTKNKIYELSKRGYDYLVKRIPADHDVVMRGISEYSSYDLEILRKAYLFTVDEDRDEFINELRSGLELIKAGREDELNEVEGY